MPTWGLPVLVVQPQSREILAPALLVSRLRRRGSVLGPGSPWVTIQPDEQLGQLPQLRVGEAAAAPAPAALLVVVWAAIAVLAALSVALARQTRVIALHTAWCCQRTFKKFYSEKTPTEPSPSCGKRPLVTSAFTHIRHYNR